MSALFHEILQQERARLLRDAANLFALPKSETDLAGLFVTADKLHRFITSAIQQQSHELDKDELIHLQSSLHITVGEQLKTAVEEQFARCIKTLTQMAELDPLTQLPNRAAFERRLHNEAVRARRYGRDFSLVLFDVDNFKSVNDRFGHMAGDQVLAGVARELQLLLRQSDAVFRYGGDEFIALCPETSPPATNALLKRLEDNLHNYPAQPELTAGISVSWGISSFPADTADVDELIRLADRRLYDCKKDHHLRAAART
ncbi:MAG: GGDEF domain-containing protein [Blastocatellia bacterium]